MATTSAAMITYVGSGLSKTLGFQKGEQDKCNEIETTLTAFRFLQIQDPVIKLRPNFRCLESLETYTFLHVFGPFDSFFDLLSIGEICFRREGTVKAIPEERVTKRVFATEKEKLWNY